MAEGLYFISCVCVLLLSLPVITNVSSELSDPETLSQQQTLTSTSIVNPLPVQHLFNQQHAYGTHEDTTPQNIMTDTSHNKHCHRCADSTSMEYKDSDTACINKKADIESEKTVNPTQTNSCSIKPNPDPCQYQLVPYEPNRRILPMFHEKRRVFEFAGKQWTISQEWDEVGVASVVWEAALMLSRYLETVGPDVIVGKRVIELGAGTGLVGMVASSLGAQSVIMTDKNPDPAEANLKLNSHNLVDRSISVTKLEWGSDIAGLEPPFDVILAADVIYIEETYPLLIKTLKELSSTETVILLSGKRRYDRDDRFFKLLLDTGCFSSEVVDIWTEVADVKVYKIKYTNSS